MGNTLAFCCSFLSINSSSAPRTILKRHYSIDTYWISSSYSNASFWGYQWRGKNVRVERQWQIVAAFSKIKKHDKSSDYRWVRIKAWVGLRGL